MKKRAAARCLKKVTELPDHQHFPHVVAGKEELDRGKLLEQVLNMPIVEHALQLELRTALQLQLVCSCNVIAVIGRVRTGVLGMEVREQDSARLQDACHTLHRRFDHGFGKIVTDVPAED